MGGLAVLALTIGGAGCAADEPAEKAEANPPTAQPETNNPPEEETGGDTMALLQEGQDLFADIFRWSESNMDISTAADVERVCSQLRTYERKVERLEEIVDEVATSPLGDDKAVGDLDEALYGLQGVFDALRTTC